MESVGVLIKHSGWWNIENVYEDYQVDAIAISAYASFRELYDSIVQHLGLDIGSKAVEIEYKFDNEEKPIKIHNDMSVKVYILHKKERPDCTTLPLYVSMVDLSIEKVDSNTSLNDEMITSLSGTDIQIRHLDDLLNSGAIISDPAHIQIEEDQVYVNKNVLKSVFLEYSIREKFNFKAPRSNRSCYTVTCASDECSFLLRASQISKSGMFCVRRFNKEHTCPLKNRVYNTKHATSKLIGGIVKSKFRNPKRKYTPKEIQEDILESIGMDVSYMVCWRARELAIESLRGKPAASYSRLPSYLYMLNSIYPGSTIRMEKTHTDEFLYLYVSLYTFIREFQHCRPIVVVDACHMKGIYRGTFVCASTLDGAGHILPLAYGVVDSENDASWMWFFERFKEAYGERENMCFVSDRNESIIKAVSRVYPGIQHYACIWHLWNNVKKNYRKSHDSLTEIFYTMAKAYKRSDFEKLMEKVEAVDVRVKEYLRLAGYEKWARCFAPVNRGFMMTSNIAESVNAAIVSTRELPIFHFLEDVRKLFGKWNFENRQEASYTFTDLAGTNKKLLIENEAKCTRMKVVPSSEFIYTVHDRDRHFIVCLKEKTCTCVQFQLDEIPCPHACAVLRKRGLEAVDYSSDLYKPQTVMMTYDMHVQPLPDEVDWVIPEDVQKERVLPPIFKRQAGRPKKVERWKSVGEKSGKKLRHCCSTCGRKGHNRRSCGNGPSNA